MGGYGSVRAFHVEHLVLCKARAKLFSFYGGQPEGAMCSVKWVGKIFELGNVEASMVIFLETNKSPHEEGYLKISAVGNYAGLGWLFV